MATIKTSDLTTVKITGTGVFDELMQAVQSRLDSEFKKGRIQGADYSKVYLGALDSTMNQSVQFLLNKQVSDKQADLINQQTLNAEQENLLLQAQINKLIAETALITQNTANAVIAGDNLTKTGLQIVAQTSLITAQETKTAADTTVALAQELKIDQETILVAQNNLTEIQRTALTTAQKDKTLQDIAVGLVQEADIVQSTAVKVAQVSSINQDIAKSQQEVLNLIKAALKTVADTSLTDQNTANALTTNTVIANQALKVASETTLLGRKADTEEAQVSDTVNAVPVAGVVAKQKTLYTRQADGFLRDAEQKLAKIQTDAWSVRMSVDPTGTSIPNNIGDLQLNKVLEVAQTNVGATGFGQP